MIRSIDHLVILVRSLEQATADFTDLGFTVTSGGEHTDGATHNALIVFAEPTQAQSSYLELIAFKREAPEHRWWRHTASGAGLIDFALLPDAIAEAIAAAQQRGLDFQGPVPGGRRRLNGAELRWSMGFPPTPDLPFLCADVTPRTLRVPAGPQLRHANACEGIANLTIVVTNLAASAARYRALLGSDPLPDAPAGEPDARSSRFQLGTTTIILAEPPATANNALRAHLNQRGEGPYALTLRVSAGTPITPAEEIRVHGVRMRFERSNHA